ncbi:MAG: hypothetical protein ABIH20_03895 [Candidatus Diapherotrites archaeon]
MPLPKRQTTRAAAAKKPAASKGGSPKKHHAYPGIVRLHMRETPFSTNETSRKTLEIVHELLTKKRILERIPLRFGEEEELEMKTETVFREGGDLFARNITGQRKAGLKKQIHVILQDLILHYGQYLTPKELHQISRTLLDSINSRKETVGGDPPKNKRGTW